jgi:23S rRNA (cytidine2498-2'-O)-methyltransferase
VHLVLAADDSKDELKRELRQAFPAGHTEIRPGLFSCEPSTELEGALPHLAFARQLLPNARLVRADSIRDWAALLAEAVVGVLPDHQPWSLHVYPFKEVQDTTRMGARAWHTRARSGQEQPARREPSTPKHAGQNRCQLIREALAAPLQKRRRHLLRSLRAEPGAFAPAESLVQLLMISPVEGFLSVALEPFAFEQRHVLSCFPAGLVELATDKQAPSRAFAKLVEAEARMGRRIAARERCVDLGAAPGSWTYVAASRGASVTAVDRSQLRPDLLRNPLVHFQAGDAFRFEPEAPVDWLLCDVIAAAERSGDLLSSWLQKRWARHFVVTLKLDDAGSSEVLARLKRDLPALTSELWLMRLCANKKEVCAFGTRAR